MTKKDRPKGWYDDLDGICYATFSLERVHELITERAAAYYDRKEGELKGWVILGAIALDSCGNAGLIDPEAQRELTNTSRVMTMSDFVALPRAGSFSYEMGRRVVPPPHAECPVCGRGWGLANWKDAVFVVEETFHKKCRRYVREAVNQEYFENAFTAAGYETHSRDFTRIPNEYWTRTPEYGESWFLVQVPFGVIKLGWRKRVVELRWGKTELARQPDFSKEEVTREETMIHAWGLVKLIEYLRAIRECAAVTEAK